MKATAPKPAYVTALGRLYEADCMDVLPTLNANLIDTIFADPPFNLRKSYGRKSSDDMPDAEYLDWCKQWLNECIRILKPITTRIMILSNAKLQ